MTDYTSQSQAIKIWWGWEWAA